MAPRLTLVDYDPFDPRFDGQTMPFESRWDAVPQSEPQSSMASMLPASKAASWGLWGAGGALSRLGYPALAGGATAAGSAMAAVPGLVALGEEAYSHEPNTLGHLLRKQRGGRSVTETQRKQYLEDRERMDVPTPTEEELADYDAQPMSPFMKVVSAATGTNGVPRQQSWIEALLRSGASLPHDVMTGEQQTPLDPPRGEQGDILPPVNPKDSSWIGRALGVGPVRVGNPFDELVERAQDMTALAGSGPLAAAPKGAVGIFGGRVSKTADLAALKAAEELEARGVHRDDIWRQTGWGRNPAGQWFNEIPDNTAHLSSFGRDSIAEGNTRPLGKLGTFWHENLYKGYPEAKDWTLHKGALPDTAGTYFPNGHPANPVSPGPSIGLAKQFPPDMKSTLLHEVNHGVQEVEGFPRGGMPSQFKVSPKTAEYYADVAMAVHIQQTAKANGMSASQFLLANPDVRRMISGEIEGLARYTPEKQLTNTYANLQQQIELGGRGGYEGYNRLAGEVQSRAVQKREKLTPEERRARPPWMDYDVPEDKQIVQGLTNQGPGASVVPPRDIGGTPVTDRIASPELEVKPRQELTTQGQNLPTVVDPAAKSVPAGTGVAVLDRRDLLRGILSAGTNIPRVSKIAKLLNQGSPVSDLDRVGMKQARAKEIDSLYEKLSDRAKEIFTEKTGRESIKHDWRFEDMTPKEMRQVEEAQNADLKYKKISNAWHSAVAARDVAEYPMSEMFGKYGREAIARADGFAHNALKRSFLKKNPQYKDDLSGPGAVEAFAHFKDNSDEFLNYARSKHLRENELTIEEEELVEKAKAAPPRGTGGTIFRSDTSQPGLAVAALKNKVGLETKIAGEAHAPQLPATTQGPNLPTAKPIVEIPKMPEPDRRSFLRGMVSTIANASRLAKMARPLLETAEYERSGFRVHKVGDEFEITRPDGGVSNFSYNLGSLQEAKLWADKEAKVWKELSEVTPRLKDENPEFHLDRLHEYTDTVLEHLGDEPVTAAKIKEGIRGLSDFDPKTKMLDPEHEALPTLSKDGYGIRHDPGNPGGEYRVFQIKKGKALEIGGRSTREAAEDYVKQFDSTYQQHGAFPKSVSTPEGDALYKRLWEKMRQVMKAPERSPELRALQKERKEIEKQFKELSAKHRTSNEMLMPSENLGSMFDTVLRSDTSQPGLAVGAASRLKLLTPEFQQVVKNTPNAELTSEGVKIKLVRAQHKDQAGLPSVREGVFYLPEGKNLKQGPIRNYYEPYKNEDTRFSLPSPDNLKVRKNPDGSVWSSDGFSPVVSESGTEIGRFPASLSEKELLEAGRQQVLKQIERSKAIGSDIGGDQLVKAEAIFKNPLIVKGNTVRGSTTKNALKQLGYKTQGYDSPIVNAEHIANVPIDKRLPQIEKFFEKFQIGHPSPELWDFVSKIKPGNDFLGGPELVKMALLETLLSRRAKALGHDSVIGTASDKIHEVFHLGETHYPSTTLRSDTSQPGLAVAAVSHSNAPAFYSAVEHALNNSKTARATPEQWVGYLKNQPGVKAEELAWMGLDDPKALGNKPLTRDEMLAHAREHGVQVKEVEKSGEGEITEEAVGDRAAQIMEREYPNLEEGSDKYYEVYDDVLMRADDELRAGRGEDDLPIGGPKFSEYQLPGGENYREMLFTLPPKGGQHFGVSWPSKDRPSYGVTNSDGNVIKDGFKTEQEARQWSRQQADKNTDYQSSHWDEPNILAHARMNDRYLDPTGEGKSTKHYEDNVAAYHFPDRPLPYRVEYPEGTPLGEFKTEAEANAFMDNYKPVPLGKIKTLHLEEVQSDWHQAGRKEGYKQTPKKFEIRERIGGADPNQTDHPATFGKTIYELHKEGENYPVASNINKDEILERKEQYEKGEIYGDSLNKGVPDAPFKTTWPDLVLKRMIRRAAEEGYDAVSWTPGEQQAARYDLSKQVDRVEYAPPNTLSHAPAGEVRAYKDGREVIRALAAPQDLPNYIGKDVADKLLKTEPVGLVKSDPRSIKGHVLSGLDLKVGGEGMKAFYDKMLVDKANALGKKFGAKVEWKDLGGKQFNTTGPSPNGKYTVYETNHAGEVARGVFNNKEDAEAWIRTAPKQDVRVPVLRLTPQLKDAALGKGFPLFSGGLPLTAVNHDPFDRDQATAHMLHQRVNQSGDHIDENTVRELQNRLK